MRRVEFKINEEDPHTGVDTISIVSEPAIESAFVAMSKEQVQYVEMKGEYKQVLAGLALIPDKDIPRTHPKTGEKFMAYFTKEGIETIRNKFHKQLMNNRVNTNHSSAEYVNAYMVESFIIDSDHRIEDLKAKGIKDPVMGSWFVAYKIEDKEVFTKALKGEFTGFSVELYLKSVFTTEKPVTHFDVDEMVKRITDAVKESMKPSPTKDKSYYEDKLKSIQNRLK